MTMITMFMMIKVILIIRKFDSDNDDDEDDLTHDDGVDDDVDGVVHQVVPQGSQLHHGHKAGKVKVMNISKTVFRRSLVCVCFKSFKAKLVFGSSFPQKAL